MSWDKGRASIYILRTAFGVDWSDRIRIIYAGDDVTDEDAMSALKGMAFSFRVVSSNLAQTAADIRLVSEGVGHQNQRRASIDFLGWCACAGWCKL